MLRSDRLSRPPRWGRLRRLALAAAAAAVAALAAPLGARAATTWTVSGTNDPATAPCAGTVCPSLRDAIIAANSGSGGDTISLGPGHFTLEIPGINEDAAATGDLDITKPVTITGAGAASTIIDGAQLDRVFDIQSGADPVTISGVTVTGGMLVGNTLSARGGGIRTAARLILSDSTLSGNYSGDQGAGLSAEDFIQATLTNVTVDGNSAPDCAGITAAGFNSTVEFRSGTISNNSARFGAGGCEDGDARLDVIDSTVTNNTACDYQPIAETAAPVRAAFSIPTCDGRTIGGAHSEAGGLAEDGFGVLTVLRTKVINNKAFLGGGVVEDGAGVVQVTDSLISGNQAINTLPQRAPARGGSFNAPDGGGFLEDGGGFLFIDRSLITGNHADRSGGGGAATGGNKVQLVNTTVTGNSAGSPAFDGSGGGVVDEGGDDVRLIHDTFTANSATGGAGGNVDNCPPDFSACQRDLSDSVIQTGNSIFAGGTVNGAPSNCGGPIDSLGHNIDSGNDCAFTAPGDLVSTNPLLGPLADNGGPTQTEALLAGSPALDAADDSRCPKTDQRAGARPQGPHCDIGAYEAAVTAAPVTVTVTAPSARVAAPGLRLRGPRQCVRSAFSARVHIASRARVLGVRVYLDGRRIYLALAAVRRPVRTFSVRIHARRLGPGLHRITVVVNNAGGSVSRTIRFRRCGAARRVSPRFTG